MLHIRMAPAEQQDLLAALDVFLSLPLYLAKQDRRVPTAGRRCRGHGSVLARRDLQARREVASLGSAPFLAGGRACPELSASPPSRPPQANRIILESQRRGERASRALPFPHSAGCQRAQALPKDVILLLRAIKPFALQAASSLQLSHAWPRAISGLKKTCVRWMRIKGSF